VQFVDEKGKLQEINLPAIDLDEVYEMNQKRNSKKWLEKDKNQRYGFLEIAPNIYQFYVRGFDFAGGPEDLAYQEFELFLKKSLSTLNSNPKSRLILNLRDNGGGSGALYCLMYRYFAPHPFKDSRYAYS